MRSVAGVGSLARRAQTLLRGFTRAREPAAAPNRFAGVQAAGTDPMLQFIRDNATGWIAWGIVILIAIPFALWGIHQYVTPNSSVAVATVDGADIDYYDFQRRYARRRQELQATFGPGSPTCWMTRGCVARCWSGWSIPRSSSTRA